MMRIIPGKAAKARRLALGALLALCPAPTLAQSSSVLNEQDADVALEHNYQPPSGTFSPVNIAKAAAAIRALPVSPLLKTASPQRAGFGAARIASAGPASASPWSYPVPPPIRGSGATGSFSARVVAIAVDPTTSNTVYAGSQGGLSKSIDGGNTWTYLSGGWNSQSIGPIAIDPQTPSNLYVGTNNEIYAAGIYRSFDGGSTWTNLAGDLFSGYSINQIAVDPRSAGSQTATTLYATVFNSGLWRSQDSGSTWTLLRNPGNFGVNDIVLDSTTVPSTLYITEADGVFRSFDSGATWTMIHADSGWDSRLAFVNGVLYHLDEDNAVNNLFKSSDQGNTWTQIVAICPPSFNCTPGNPIGITTLWGVDPGNPNIIMGGNVTMFRSGDGGNTWASLGDVVHADQRAVAFSLSDPNTIYEGNDGGLSKSVDGGATWFSSNDHLPGALVYGVGLSQDGTLTIGTQDMGAAWSDGTTPWFYYGGGDAARVPINPNDSNLFYYAGYGHGDDYRLSKTGGPMDADITPFAARAAGEATSFFPDLSMNPSQPGHLTTGFEHVWRSTDSGTDWNPIGPKIVPGTAICLSQEAPSDANVIYALVCNGQIYVTTDAGDGPNAVWQNVTGNLSAISVMPFQNLRVDPTNPSVVYVVEGADSQNWSGAVYKTSNMGLVWTMLSAPQMTYKDVAIDAVNPNTVFAAGALGVISSVDGGMTWQSMNTGLPIGEMANALAFNPVSRELAVGFFGRGVYTTYLSPTPTTIAPTLAIVSPSSYTIAGTIQVAATAADALGIAHIDLYLDGVLSTRSYSSPASFSWNTLYPCYDANYNAIPCRDASHTIVAMAYDMAGNVASDTDTVVVNNNSAKFISQSVPAAMYAGSTYTVSMTFLNNGNNAWSAAGPGTGSPSIGASPGYYPYRLGPYNPGSFNRNDSSVWGNSILVYAPSNLYYTRIPLAPGENIVPGQQKTFTFNVPAPASTGTYLFQWQMLQEWVEGFGSLTPPINVTVLPRITAPPTIAFASPAGGTALSGTVVLSGTAASAGALANVAVSIDGGPFALASGTSSWTYALNSALLSNGAHALTAQAADVSGNTATTSLSVSASNPPGLASITLTPANATLLVGKSQQFTAVAKDQNGAALSIPLTFSSTNSAVASINGAGSATALSFGSAAIYASNGGIQSNPAQLIVADNIPPSVSIASPANGSTFSAPFTINATAADNVGISQVVFAIDGVVQSTSTTSPYSYFWNNVGWFNSGAHTITATAYDSFGNTATSTVAVTVSVSNGAQFVSQSVPTTMTTGGSYPVSVTMKNTGTSTWTRGGGGGYILDAPGNFGIPQVNGNTGVALSTSDAVSPGQQKTFNFNVTAPGVPGAYNFTTQMLTTWQAFGAQSPNVSINVVDNAPPTVAILSPADGAVVMGSLTFSGVAADNVAVSNVAVSIDGSAFVPAVGTATWSYNLDTSPLGGGAHVLTVKATDSSLNSITSSVTINVSAPVLATLSLTPASIVTLVEGQSQQFNVVAKDNAGSLMTGVPFLFNSSDPTVAAVNAAGLATAVRPGPAGILASSGAVVSNVSSFEVLVTSADVVWLDDSWPAEALAPGNLWADGGDTTTWTAGTNPAPFSGRLDLQSSIASGEHGVRFDNVWNLPLTVNTGDLFLAYVYLDPVNPPSEIMIQYNDSQADWHSYRWGSDQIVPNGGNRVTEVSMGTLPQTGKWVRLQFPASLIGMPNPNASGGGAVHGMSLNAYGGRVAWDYIGKISAAPIGTTPPALAITSPANGAAVSGTILISGISSDNVAVSSVAVAADLGAYALAAGTGTWSFSLNTNALSNGAHTLSAKATDSSGIATTVSIAVTVNNSVQSPAPPTVAIAAPANGTTISGIVAIAGTAADNVAVSTVAISIDNGAYAPAGGTPANWISSLNTAALANGAHAIAAKATNSSGLTATSSITVNVGNYLLSPLPFTAVSSNSFTANWSSNFPVGTNYLLFLSSGALPNSFAGNRSNTASTTSYVFQGLSPNTSYFSRVSTASAGPFTSLGSTATLNGPPAAAVLTSIALSPAHATVAIGASQQFVAIAYDQTGKAINSAGLVFASTNPSVASINGSGLASGLYPGSAGLYASSGAVQSNMAVLYVVDTTSPTLAIVSPANNANVSGTITVSGTAADNVAVSNVAISVDGGAYALAAGTSSWTFNLNTTALSNGSHSLTAMATDSSGLATATPVVSMTVANKTNDTTPPTVSIAVSPNSVTFSGTVNVLVSAADNVGVSRVELDLDNALIATDMTAPYAFVWNTRQTPNGHHVLTAKAYDAAGNVGTAQLSLMVRNRRTKVRLTRAIGANPISSAAVAANLYGLPQAVFSISVDTVNEPDFPLAASLLLGIDMPSGFKSFGFSQASAGSGVFYTLASSAAFSFQDFFSLDADTLTVSVGTQTFDALGEGGAVMPSLGGAVTEPSGQAGVVIMPDQITQEAQLSVNPPPPDASGARASALKRQNLKSLDMGRDIVFTSSGALDSATVVLPFDPAQIPPGLSAGNVRVAYFNFNAQKWEMIDNAQVSGNSVSAAVTHFSLYTSVLQLPIAAPGLIGAYAFPDPAVAPGDVTIRACLGTVNDASVTIFDVSGRVVNSATVSSLSAASPVSGTNGPCEGQNAYDYKWTGAKASGAYFAVVHGRAADGSTIKARVKFAVVR